jgi:prophage regulatory protein
MSDQTPIEPQRLRLIRIKEVKFRTGLSVPTIYRRMAAGTFPKSHSLGGSIVAWSERDIEDWIAGVLAGTPAT